MMLFRNKNENKLQVDFGDMKEKIEHLADFLQNKLKVDVSVSKNKMFIETQGLSPQKLEKAVTKYVYHQNLNARYWASLDGNVVKINQFKGSKKPEKQKKKKQLSSTTITQSWGL
jgi:hypothetical protein